MAAGLVKNGEDLTHHDPQLKHRGYFTMMDHPILEKYTAQGWPVKLSKTPYRLKRAPLLGEHTEKICRNILGLSDDEFVTYFNEGVLK